MVFEHFYCSYLLTLASHQLLTSIICSNIIIMIIIIIIIVIIVVRLLLVCRLLRLLLAFADDDDAISIGVIFRLDSEPNTCLQNLSIQQVGRWCAGLL